MSPAADSSASRPRLHQLDWLRALGILLVVYGHSMSTGETVHAIIYAFHIPLFFFASGFLLSPRRVGGTFSEFAGAIARTLVWPYLVFAIICYGCWLLVLRRFGADAASPVPWWQPLVAILYGSGSRDDLLQPVVLWFFPCLVTAQLLLWPLARLRWPLNLVLLAGFTVTGLLVGDLILPWELESALVAVSFLWAGFVFANNERIRAWTENLHPLAAAIGLGLATYLSLLNDPVDMRISHFGKPWLFFIVAFLHILCLYALACRLPPNAWTRNISASTLVIFPLHLFGFSALAAVYVYVFHLPLSFRQEPAVGAIASLLLVIVLTVAAPTIASVLQLHPRPQQKLRA
jgi:acyltransferase